MQTKLTLRMEEEPIERAKTYSQRVGKSVSQLFSDYVKMLPEEKPATGSKSRALPPIVRSMKGALHGAEIDEQDYRRHLEDKHR